MIHTVANPITCAYCSSEFEPNHDRERFCSDRCTKLFSTKYQLSDPSKVDLSTELLRLQTIIQSIQTPNHSWTKEAGLAFYDSVFNQLSLIVKWINSQSTQSTNSKLQQELEELEHQYFTILKKAADLKKENASLKERVSKFENADYKLARTLLGLDEKFSKTELKTSFKNKVKQLHPDVHTGDADIFKAIKKAFDLLNQ